MRKADLEKALKAGAAVAVWPRPRDFPLRAARAEIVRLGEIHPFDVKKRNGVRMRFPDGVPRQCDHYRPVLRVVSGGFRPVAITWDMNTDDRVLGPRDVIALWDEYVVQRDRIVARENAGREARDAAEREKEEAAAALTALGFPASAAGYEVLLSVETAQKLAAALRVGRDAVRSEALATAEAARSAG